MPSKAQTTTPGQPLDHEGPVFREPWEASAFAIVVKLSEAGYFTWPEWVECMSTVIKEAEAGHDHDHDDIRHHDEDESEYYTQWFMALETMLKKKGIIDPALIDARHQHLKDNPVPHDHVARRDPVFVAKPS